MTRFSLSLAALFCVAGLAWADDKTDIAKETKKFQGTWTIESSVTGGQEIPRDQLKGFLVIYEGDRHTLKYDGKVFQVGTQKIDPSKSPKTIDVTMTEGPEKGKVLLGIYEFDGDTMKACFDPTGKNRPTVFKSEAGSQNFLNVHKRVASADTDAPKDAVKANDLGPEHANLKAFVGTWELSVEGVQEKGIAEIKSILGGRFVTEDVKVPFGGFTMEWHGVLGFDRAKKQYTGVWFDNMANTTESGAGEADPTGRVVSFRGEQAGHGKFLWRISNDGKKAMTIEMFQVAKDGKETPVMKVRGERKK
jgi:uncharacterized protein (TIGR03067 family)